MDPSACNGGIMGIKVGPDTRSSPLSLVVPIAGSMGSTSMPKIWEMFCECYVSGSPIPIN